MANKSFQHGERSGLLTTAEIEASDSSAKTQFAPEFIRIPKSGPCPYTGLCRSTMYGLLTPTEENGYRPPVKSVSLRKPGQTKGTRLIVLQSLLDYLRHEVEVFQRSIAKRAGK